MPVFVICSSYLGMEPHDVLLEIFERASAAVGADVKDTVELGLIEPDAQPFEGLHTPLFADSMPATVYVLNVPMPAEDRKALEGLGFTVQDTSPENLQLANFKL